MLQTKYGKYTIPYMVELITSSVLIGEELTQPTTLSPSQNKTFFKVADSKIETVSIKYSHFSRSLPRDGFLALQCIEDVVSRTNVPLGGDRVGLYTAFQNGPALYPLVDKTNPMPPADAVPYFKKWWPPKQHFRQNAPIRANHFAIALGLNGPQMCFVDPISGLTDAINAAEIDLALNQIDYALVVAAHSFEDRLTLDFYSETTETLFESSVVLLLKKSSDQKIKLTPKAQGTIYKNGVCSPYFNKEIIF